MVEEWIQIRLVAEELQVDCVDMWSHGVMAVVSDVCCMSEC